MVWNFGLLEYGVFGAHDLCITGNEFRVFMRVLMKLSKKSAKERKWDPCWRALKSVVFVVEGELG